MNTEGGPIPEEPTRDPWLESRVSRLEDDMGAIRTLRRLERVELKDEIDDVKIALADKPSRITCGGSSQP